MLSLLLGVGSSVALTPHDAQAILQIEAQRLPAAALQDFVTHDDPATRARAARALGRLRTAASLPALKALAADPDPDVRFEVAFALGQTEGAERTLLDRARRENAPQVRTALYAALGKQGTEDAIPALLTALRRPAPLIDPHREQAAAAVALGRLAMRDVSRARGPAPVSALVEAVESPHLAVRRGAAFSLSRMKLERLLPGQAPHLFQQAEQEPDPVTQAYLIRATARLQGAGPLRSSLLEAAAHDPDSGVRVAAARAAATAGWAGVTQLLDDPAPGVRLEAIRAVGTLATTDREALLLPLVERGLAAGTPTPPPRASDAVLEGAAAAAALAQAELLRDPDTWIDPARPTPIRAAVVAVLNDPDALLRLATADGEAPVRMAAAVRLTEHNPDPAQAIGLLGAFDPMVVAVGADWLAENPEAKAEPALLEAFTDADEPDLLAAACKALTALYQGPSPRVKRPAPGAAGHARRLASHPALPVREAAAALADALKIRSSPSHHLFITAPLEQVSTVRAARVYTARGEAIIELFPEEAPITVWNFANLADAGFFDNLRLHRAVPDFVIQDGDPRGDGTGGPGWTIPDEINPIPYNEGTVGMALAGPDTGGSQWFVTLSPQPHLDGAYTVFGRVVQGMHVMQELRQGDLIHGITIERTAPTAAAWTDQPVATEE